MRNRKSVIFFYLPLTLIMIFILFPFLWALINSFKRTTEIFDASFSIFPRIPTISSYVSLFNETGLFKGMKNSLVVASVTAFINMIVSTMSAYAFTRYRFKGSKNILKLILIIYILPQVIFVPPLFVIMRTLDVLQTLWSVIIACCTFTLPFSIWLMTGFMSQIPFELEESAKVDGCNRFTAFFHILLPIIKPGLTATLTYIFINGFNEYLFGAMFTNNETRTLSVELASFIGQFEIRWDLVTSGIVVAVIPVILLFSLVQKNFISGLTAGAVKG